MQKFLATRLLNATAILAIAAIAPTAAQAESFLEKQTAIAEQQCQEALASGSASELLRVRMMYWMYDTTCSARAQTMPEQTPSDWVAGNDWPLFAPPSFSGL